MSYKDTDKYREHHRKYMAEWYRKNKHRHMAYTKKNALERKIWLQSLKAGKSCSCGESHPACLEWHHRDKSKKLFNISNAWFSKELILREIEKCILICSNCHRKLHVLERLSLKGG
jgi:hypothetical protein